MAAARVPDAASYHLPPSILHSLRFIHEQLQLLAESNSGAIWRIDRASTTAQSEHHLIHGAVHNLTIQGSDLSVLHDVMAKVINEIENGKVHEDEKPSDVKEEDVEVIEVVLEEVESEEEQSAALVEDMRNNDTREGNNGQRLRVAENRGSDSKAASPATPQIPQASQTPTPKKDPKQNLPSSKTPFIDHFENPRPAPTPKPAHRQSLLGKPPINTTVYKAPLLPTPSAPKNTPSYKKGRRSDTNAPRIFTEPNSLAEMVEELNREARRVSEGMLLKSRLV
ncbi:hypothetical protein BDV96DRAFT_144307 [Lophiotrema nucula]|uniref:Uncharacterized protein n=1 Tax=Lophiotrema nucula TaxID=690887 RepID=A0A6A5ZRU6_9PLEO|nr:hypothetical protein BDV96DRAFT_144307 [Lophiotrema nucula]